MVDCRKAVKIGVLAEEVNDVEVLYELTCKIISETKFSFDKFVGHGCGKLKAKCAAWANVLLGKGCKHLVVLHDLDCYAETILRKELEASVKKVGFAGYLILIPTREIEAWLLVDLNALCQVFGDGNPKYKLPARPESVSDPKKKLRDIVWKSTKKRYINTIHNRQLAKHIDLIKLNLCKSFVPYPRFIKSL